MPLQETIAEHLDLDQSSVSRLCAELGIDWRNTSMDSIRVAYIRKLREMAAGRAAEGGVDLATERARLAREQADKVAMQNAVTRGELTPTVVLEQVLTACASKAAGIFDAIPGAVRRRFPDLPAATIDVIATEIAKARNYYANMSLSDLGLDDGATGDAEEETRGE